MVKYLITPGITCIVMILGEKSIMYLYGHEDKEFLLRGSMGGAPIMIKQDNKKV